MLKLSHLTLVTILTLAPSAAFTQRKPDLAGDFLGSLAPLHLKLHLASKPGGSLTGSLDSINHGAIAYDPALPGSPIYLANTSPPESRAKPQSACSIEPDSDTSSPVRN